MDTWIYIYIYTYIYIYIYIYIPLRPNPKPQALNPEVGILKPRLKEALDALDATSEPLRNGGFP